MSFTQEQKDQFDLLMKCRNDIFYAVRHIELILQTYFPEEYDTAYQHWIPQIITALYEDSRWLPRGERTMQQTMISLIDKMKSGSDKGVSKYIN